MSWAVDCPRTGQHEPARSAHPSNSLRTLQRPFLCIDHLPTLVDRRLRGSPAIGAARICTKANRAPDIQTVGLVVIPLVSSVGEHDLGVSPSFGKGSD